MIETSGLPGSVNGRIPQEELSRQSKFVSEDYRIGLLDEINRQIISILEENSIQSQMEIPKKLDLSQSSIALRLDRLYRSGVITNVIGVNLEKIGMGVCRVDVTSSDVRSVIDWSRACPLF